MTDLAERARKRVPRRFWDARLNDATESCKKVKEFLESNDNFLLLTGHIGVGKTYACYAGIIERENGGVYHNAVRLGQLLFTDKAKTIHDMEDTGLLVLDDIGTEIVTEKQWFTSILDSTIDFRYEWMRKTIITTNLTVADFTERYGERIASRLTENGSVWELTGEDLRESDVKPEPKDTEPLKQKVDSNTEKIPDVTPEEAAENRKRFLGILSDLPPSETSKGYETEER
jgi:DNA replication protein DnaC